MRLPRPLYVAHWGEDVTGSPPPGRRVQPPPRSRSGYAYFGGRITSGPFAPLDASPARAQEWYRSQREVARCRLVEDGSGIRLRRPGPLTRWALRGCRLAGDWRQINGSLELVAVVAVERAR